jgi:hypothetical protein
VVGVRGSTVTTSHDYLINARPFCTTTAASFTIPAAGSTVAVTLAVASSWTAVGQTLFIADGTRWIFSDITTVTDTTHVTVNNRGYPGVNTSGTMASGARVALVAPGIATATQPGFLPTPPNSTTQFLRGDASYATPPTVGASAAGYAPAYPNNTTTFFRGDGSYASLPSNSTSAAGTVATAPNDVNQVYRGDATWNVAIGEWETNASFTWPASGSTVAITFISTTGMTVGMTLAFLDSGNKFVMGDVTVVTDSTHATVKNQNYIPSTGSGTIATKALAWTAGPGLASSTQPGFLPAPPNNTTTFLRGDATFATPPSATATVAGYVPTPPNSTTQWLRGDATFAALPANSTSAAGTVATAPNSTSQFYRGDATWATPPTVSTGAAGYAPTLTNTGYKFLRDDGGYQMVSKSIRFWHAKDADTPSSAYPVYTTVNNNAVLSFDPATKNTCTFAGVMPDQAPLGSGLTVRIFWCVPSGGDVTTSHNCVWGAAFDRANSGATFTSDSFGTAGTVTTAITATAGTILISTISALTTIDSIAAGDAFRLQVYRDAANASDTLTSASLCYAVELQTAAT